MQRILFSALSGAIFGLGLTISGMTDTTRVQGWLDVFGEWDATLAFVMGGAILPMAVAWRVAARMYHPVLGGSFPSKPKTEVGANLVVGSILFGMGWALAGLCPGPAIASLGFGGWGGVLFLLAMLAGMFAAPPIRAGIDRISLKRSPMHIRALTGDYAVSPQIDPSDLPAIKAAGYVTVIDNRPDGEIGDELQAAEMRKAAEALGLTFVVNPAIPGQFTADLVETQRAAIAASTGPVFAYCASGNRSTIIWELVNAGKIPTDQMIETAARHGYNHEQFRPLIESFAKP